MPRLILFLFILLVAVSCTSEVENTASEEITSLPMNEISLENLDAFRDFDNNWQVAGGVHSDYLTDHSIEIQEGTGILVNIPTEEDRSNLFTDLEHGDLELKVEFMVPGGSNSGIYFQGRYELQILDSWGAGEINYGSLGGIYQRWDESQPAGEEGYEGYAPGVNAAKAPGLWQDFHVLFRAPRFDDEGNKIQNAMFEEVYLNGKLIHEDVELSGPTRGALSEGEAETGPIAIQGDHGPVAFRNIRYKAFSRSDSVSLSDLTYTVFDYNGNILPDFDTLSNVIAEGTTSYFEPSDLSPQNDHYAIWYSGTLDIPVEGDYLFQTQLSKGGNLYINDELILPNDGAIDYYTIGNIIHLPAGTHQIDLSYFQITWSTNISLYYEGPNMEKSQLGSPPPERRGGGGGGGGPSPVLVEPVDSPELIGGFVNYKGEKRTHVLSVGSPTGVHYNYDLNQAEPLNYWKGGFADVTEMWRGRGESQLLKPLNAVLAESSGTPVVLLDGNGMISPQNEEDSTEVLEYSLNDEGRPIFSFEFGGISVQDELNPSQDATGFVRILRFESENQVNNAAARIARGNDIELLPNGVYSINGQYYIQMEDTGDENPSVIEQDGTQHLIIPVLGESGTSEIQYQIIW